MAIEHLSAAANTLTKLLKNKYHIPITSKVSLELLKIIESDERKIAKYTKNFNLQNKNFFEKHGQEVIKLSYTYGAIQIQKFLKKKYSETPSLSTFKRFLMEVKNGKSQGK